MAAKMKLNWLQDNLRTKYLGRSILFSRKVNSTNDWAKKLARYGAQAGTTVVAATQTKGHGRLGREWISPAGGLWFSIILRPKLLPSEVVRLTFVAGLAVAKVLDKVLGLDVETKWPNDLLIKGRKICGILTEMNTKDENVNFVVIGIGVNMNLDANAFPRKLRQQTTSLEIELGRRIRSEELLKNLLQEMDTLFEHLKEEGFDSILGAWKQYTRFLGHRVEVTSPANHSTGVALDVDCDGSLLLKLDDGEIRRITVGDISSPTR
ncbi:MAG: biotin--[acetyl-CoA-carboxylase] ligase [Candidatus Bathyarchaeota archaeon]|nr:MAG: biotin--[acetyl-CoA-carboxylase] ligase [Candidatus Bathyarchaeota archaeon]